jgi:molybdopterin-containing oxidoreductase family iron-sulfur binding subunit
MQREPESNSQGNAEKARKISRRRFLAGAGAAAAAVGLPAMVRYRDEAQAAAGAPAARAKHRWVMVFDLRLCDGCDKCTEACQKMHYNHSSQTWIKVYKLEHPAGHTYYMPRTCMMCDNPPCTKVCPVSATYQDDEGIVLVDQRVCIGCRMCMAACPYEARYFNWVDPKPVPTTLEAPRPEWPVPQQKGTVGKCVFCVHNLRYGKLPACLESCNMEAIFVGDLVTDLATNGKKTVKLSQYLNDNHAVRFKEELGTSPRVWYILGHGQSLNH